MTRALAWLSRALLYPAGVGLLSAAPLLLSGLWHAPRWFYAVMAALLGMDCILAAFGVIQVPLVKRPIKQEERWLTTRTTSGT